jgi:hypothetical protein
MHWYKNNPSGNPDRRTNHNQDIALWSPRLARGKYL